jgi:hypothetical protein
MLCSTHPQEQHRIVSQNMSQVMQPGTSSGKCTLHVLHITAVFGDCGGAAAAASGGGGAAGSCTLFLAFTGRWFQYWPQHSSCCCFQKAVQEWWVQQQGLLEAEWG